MSTLSCREDDLALLIGLLQRTESATIGEVVEATGWQAHTVRGAIAGALKKRLGLTITSEKEAERGRVYRVRHGAGSPAAEHA